MTCCNRIKTVFYSEIIKSLELYSLVTDDAGVWSSGINIFTDEVLFYLLKGLAAIYLIKLNTNRFRYLASCIKLGIIVHN